MKHTRLAFVVLVAAGIAFGPSIASADAANNYAQQAKKKCKNKKGQAKSKCINKTKKSLKAQDNPPVTIRTTEYGIPRIVADSDRGLGFGYGYSLAKENICTLAENYISLRGEKSKYFGPDGGNLNSDFVRKQIVQQGKVRELLAKKGVNAVKPGAREVIRGYVLGYNRYLKEVGRSKIPDATCRGKAWVKPITEQDVYLRFYELLGYAGTGQAIDGIAEAAPPGASTAAKVLGSDFKPELDLSGADEGSLGSNAVGLGSEATSTSKGMLFGNPHFPWSGSLRMFQSQLTIPGKLNVSGGSLFGVPMVMIGHTQRAAWSHTVSTARRFVIYRLELSGRTAYLEDGRRIKMQPRKVTVESKQPDGSIRKVTRTLYSTEHGPVVESFPGVPAGTLDWTNEYAYVLKDPNLDSFRAISHFYDINRAQSVAQIERILDKYQAIPWVNTIAADSEGNAFYGDIGVIPNVTDEKVQGSCGVNPLLWSAGRLAVLDGSDRDCLLGKATGAAVPGILPRSLNPRLTRQDYASNMNDSYWLANPKQPLTGFPRIIGDENAPRSLRTRNGLVQIAEQLAAGGKFELTDVQDQLTNGRNYGAELLRQAVVNYCTANPSLTPTTGAAVDVSGACAALAAYGSTDKLDDPGALLWRRIAIRLPLTDSSGAYTGALYQNPFVVSDPVSTPSGLNTADPKVGKAIADAVQEFNTAGVAFTARLRDHQYVIKNGERIPIPGGPGGLGVYNAINVNSLGNLDPEGFVPSTLSYSEVPSGSSFVIAASLDGNKCPEVRTILTYSQAATNASSPYYADQTKLFSEGGWVTDRFCRSQQLADPTVKTKKLNGGSKADRRGW